MSIGGSRCFFRVAAGEWRSAVVPSRVIESRFSFSRSPPMKLYSAILALGLALASGRAGAEEGKYKTYRDAANAGAKALNSGDLAAAREPLEAALKLAATAREKLDANRTLLIPYREVPDIEPMQRAAEFVVANTLQPAERSVTRLTMLSFVHKRGKMDAAIAGYEARRKKDSGDETALYLLVEAYANFKRDPAKAADAGEQLAAIEEKAGQPGDPTERAKLAEQQTRAGRPKAGAELYEKVAATDKALEAWHLKEAAAAWLKAGDKTKAVAAARKSAAAAPEARDELLTYFWRRGLGDALLDAGEPKDAIPQYEKALAVVKIEGYAKETREKLEKAKKAAGQ